MDCSPELSSEVEAASAARMCQLVGVEEKADALDLPIGDLKLAINAVGAPR
jgi:hypothetical protein